MYKQHIPKEKENKFDLDEELDEQIPKELDAQEVQISEEQTGKIIQNANKQLEEIEDLLENNNSILVLQKPSKEMKNQLEIIREKLNDLYDLYNQYLDKNKGIDKIAQLYFCQAVVSQNLQEFEEALYLYDQILQIYQKQEDKGNMGVVLNNMGNIFLAQKQFRKAEKYHYKALKQRKRQQLIDEVVQSYTNLGNLYLEIQNSPKYVECQENIVKYQKKKPDIDPISLGISFNDYGVALMYNCQNKKAHQSFQQAIKLFYYAELDEMDKFNIGQTYFCMGVNHYQQEEFEDSIEAFSKSQEVYEQDKALWGDRIAEIEQYIHSCNQGLKDQEKKSLQEQQAEEKESNTNQQNKSENK